MAGAAGAAGNAGTNGDAGARGPPGPAGATGAAGAAGTNGTDGEAGPTGPTGAPGPTGPPGTSGQPGAGGDVGPTGHVGPTGNRGPTGAPGATGVNGTDGEVGAQGATGPAGAAGADGGSGGTGATGPSGAAGSNGTDGATGAPGPPGTPANTSEVEAHANAIEALRDQLDLLLRTSAPTGVTTATATVTTATPATAADRAEGSAAATGAEGDGGLAVGLACAALVGLIVLAVQNHSLSKQLRALEVRLWESNQSGHSGPGLRLDQTSTDLPGHVTHGSRRPRPLQAIASRGPAVTNPTYTVATVATGPGERQPPAAPAHDRDPAPFGIVSPASPTYATAKVRNDLSARLLTSFADLKSCARVSRWNNMARSLKCNGRGSGLKPAFSPPDHA